MKREILFRGKRIDNDNWIYGDLIHWNSLGLTAITPQEGDQWTSPSNFKVYPESVGQFTGLTDKNGVKIFEGDIVAFQRTRNFEKEYVLPKEMKWEDRAKDGGVSGWTQFYPINQFGVIGNIHDNPELLKD